MQNISKLTGVRALLFSNDNRYEFPCCNSAPSNRDDCEDPQLPPLACNVRVTRKSNCLPNDGEEGMTKCFTPGYLIDGGTTGSGVTCAGTPGACQDIVVCNEAAGYSGLAALTCPTDGGYFRMTGCSRDNVHSDTGIPYLVAPFQECDESDNSFVISTLTSVTVQVSPRCPILEGLC